MEALKTCLLIDARKLDAMCLDGPALRIGMQTQSYRLFPLRRIARIHIIGAPHVGLDALLHCAEQQIPIAFFTLRGKLRCQLYPWRIGFRCSEGVYFCSQQGARKANSPLFN